MKAVHLVLILFFVTACAPSQFSDEQVSSHSAALEAGPPDSADHPATAEQPAEEAPENSRPVVDNETEPAPDTAPDAAPDAAPDNGQEPAPVATLIPANQILAIVNSVSSVRFTGSFINGGCEGANPSHYGICIVLPITSPYLNYNASTLAAVAENANNWMKGAAQMGYPLGSPGIPYGTVSSPPTPTLRPGVRNAGAAECRAAGMPVDTVACQLPQ